MNYTTKYELYSIPSVNKASLEVRDNIMKVLKDKNYLFHTLFNDLYFLKPGNTVRRLKGYFTFDLSEAMFLDVKRLIESCSTDKFKCEFNRIGKYKSYYGYESKPDPQTFIIKIENK